jgi:hypothetical protein
LAGPLIGLIALSTVVLGGAGPAAACSCDIPVFSEYADEVAIAFSGRQVERTRPSGPNDEVLATFEVDVVYKGEAGSTLTVRTWADEGACGIDPGPGLTHIATFDWSNDEITTMDLCGSQVSKNDLLAEFGPGQAPDPELADAGLGQADGDGTGWGTVLLGVGAVIALAGCGLLGFRRLAAGR